MNYEDRVSISGRSKAFFFSCHRLQMRSDENPVSYPASWCS